MTFCRVNRSERHDSSHEEYRPRGQDAEIRMTAHGAGIELVSEWIRQIPEIPVTNMLREPEN